MTRTVSQRIQYNAKCFLIWREATAVDWKCSPRELADATRLDWTTVHNILKKRDWMCRLNYDNRDDPKLNWFVRERVAISIGLTLPKNQQARM